jgi:hypothetical protein
MKALGFAILLLTAGGCVCSRFVTADIWEPRQMVETVLRLAPVGTPIDDAQRMMEREGFKCSRVTNGDFFVSIREEQKVDTEEQREGLDFVRCSRLHDGCLVYSTWEVALVHRDGKVAEVLPQVRFYGP